MLMLPTLMGLSIKYSVGVRGLTTAEHEYVPLSTDFNVVKVTDVLYISCTPSKSDTKTLRPLSVSEVWPLHCDLIETGMSISGLSSTTQVSNRE